MIAAEPAGRRPVIWGRVREWIVIGRSLTRRTKYIIKRTSIGSLKRGLIRGAGLTTDVAMVEDWKLNFGRKAVDVLKYIGFRNP
jgi:hypothetical protein